MQEQEFELGLIGLGTMGQNLLMNMADSGFSVAGYDKDPAKVNQLHEVPRQYKITGLHDVDAFIKVLKKPRVVMLLVPAGLIVDTVMKEILPLLEPGDVIIDGGNSHYTDTNRRLKMLDGKGVHFVGMGISGGAEGARRGPSMMPGGHENAWDRIKDIFEATAAKVNGEPCVAYMGSGSAGHYVKMVHNGIEYGLMELIAEAYDLMRRILIMDNDQIGEVFLKWNDGRLQSYLIEISAEIFNQKDDLTEGSLIDAIRDESKQKGTGKWTSQDAMELQVPAPGIDLAVAMRDMSGYKSERREAAKILTGPDPLTAVDLDQTETLQKLENALYFAFIVTYAQGMAILRKASEEYNYDLSPGQVARIWRGGCIIRAAMLEHFREAYNRDESLNNLLLDYEIAGEMNELQKDIREIAILGIKAGIPAMALTNAISYFDSYRSERLPANLIQAQRDFFGSHTYERKDREGTFHTKWGHNS